MDPYNLDRFVDAQRGVFEQACAELRRGRKTGHWMWFIFPQIAGLGFSEMSQWYGIRSLAEAKAYLAHPVLGPRLREVCLIVNGIEGKTAYQIFGSPDDMKLRSSVTLFAKAAANDDLLNDNLVFVEVIEKYFDGKLDERTLRLTGRG
jgi:uncharacterized protein (DUF1810 family)